MALSDFDRRLIAATQAGLPLVPRPYDAVGEMLGVTFAHGGSGFALSRGAWERSFGAGGDLVARYADFVEASSFGDYALGKVLNDYGVQLGDDETNDRTEGGAWGFNGLPHWKIEFSAENWCKPVLSWHHVHSRDVAMYYELERSWDFEKVCSPFPPLFSPFLVF